MIITAGISVEVLADGQIASGRMLEAGGVGHVIGVVVEELVGRGWIPIAGFGHQTQPGRHGGWIPLRSGARIVRIHVRSCWMFNLRVLDELG